MPVRHNTGSRYYNSDGRPVSAGRLSESSDDLGPNGRLIVHRFLLGDTGDPYIYAALPIAQFEKTEKGMWVTEHAMGDVTFTISPDYSNLGYRGDIVARFSEEDTTYFILKYGQDD